MQGIHGGVDIKYNSGPTSSQNTSNPNFNTPITGTVIKNASAYLDGLNTVSILDKQGTVHEFLHAEKTLVKPGDKVTVGQAIGKMGDTGSPAGIHVHYQIQAKNNTLVDPEVYWKN